MDMSNETSGKALVINPDGTTETIQFERGSELAKLQGLVGGYIEAVYGYTSAKAEEPDVTLFCNEEGKILNQPVNFMATTLWWSLNRYATGVDHLHGVVVVTGGADRNGDTLPVPGKVAELVEQMGG
ncbi:hypothetical protein JOEDIRT_124 [Mycobacterium phage JoeDirt]|uniref:DUF3846 domain-containing protein n=5 Tax=Bronvirus TaxID=1623278 RepID=A0A411BPH1_9CAUD|nr:hypothetical protein FGG55_gp114 [Mycobacterium phage JoeDirt]YP_010101007.1 hypothetical protein KNU44_gp106 [Mycobacterium phage CicholasNage]AEK07648.1 hypothetical protein UPIE_121 [Mycobacterium phage UPIE]AEZ50805.1 hypothetical protein [Mycobacterium phage Fezzik]AYD82288.1 hypothetical protein SEA_WAMBURGRXPRESS_124 [Mycobacterium phage Wamburgrxpress]AZS12267.1 hypothetical protein SEA_ACQUIRE49_122 [Mycobacterium phage Acquire49]QDK04115.1 hypothetical protein SEA_AVADAKEDAVRA_12